MPESIRAVVDRCRARAWAPRGGLLPIVVVRGEGVAAQAQQEDVTPSQSGGAPESGGEEAASDQMMETYLTGKGRVCSPQDGGEGEMVETEELENVSEASFAAATSQGYRTEEDEEISAFEVSMIQLGWQNDELISDRWVKIEDQPAVRVMNLVKQEDDSESGKDKNSPKEDLEKKQTMVYCVTGLLISKQQELVEASVQLRARLLEMNAFTFSAIDLEAIPVDVAYVRVQKYKNEWWTGKGTGRAWRHRDMQEMLPNLALEKHSRLGAGLTWKRLFATTTGVTRGQKDESEKDNAPYKALPLISNWDPLSRATYHSEFQKHHGVSVLTDLNGLTSLDMANIDHSMDHGIVIQAMNHPYLLSPPSVPVAGATGTRADAVKVMAFHGIVYSHKGLCDPAIMPEYVAQIREKHQESLRWATLDPQLPTWTVIRKGMRRSRWDLGTPLQAYSKPTGKEKSMVFDEQSEKWIPAPVQPKISVPEKGESKDGEKAAVHLKRRSETGADEPKAKKGSVASTKEQSKAVELKPASEVAKEKTEKDATEAAKVEATVEADIEKSEKRPHTPRSGLVLKTSEEVRLQDTGEKAPHGESSEDDEQLAEGLRMASSAVSLTPRKGQEQGSDLRSDEVFYDEEEQRPGITSSKVTVTEVGDLPYAPSEVSRITDPEEAGKRRRKSKSKHAKKLARTRRRRHSPGPSERPREVEEEESESDIDLEVFANLQDVVPGSEALGFLSQMASLTKAASRMESLMMQMGREHMNMKQIAADERRLMRKENKLLRQALGSIGKRQNAVAQEAEGSSGRRASGSRQGDPEARSRPGSARRRDSDVGSRTGP